MSSKWEELRKEKFMWKKKVVFQEDVKLLFIRKGEEFEVHINIDGYEYIKLRKMNLYLTPDRNQLGIYKIFENKFSEEQND